MNGPQTIPGSRREQIHARLEALRRERATASTDLARANKAANLLAARSRPPRALRRDVQRDRDRVKTRLAAIDAEVQQLQDELAMLHERVAAIRAELAQLGRRDDPVTAGLTISEYSERFFALQLELRDLVGLDPGAAT
jgi:septal ring factor EnvC (AmiA/AmiB activator)